MRKKTANNQNKNRRKGSMKNRLSKGRGLLDYFRSNPTPVSDKKSINNNNLSNEDKLISFKKIEDEIYDLLQNDLPKLFNNDSNFNKVDDQPIIQEQDNDAPALQNQEDPIKKQIDKLKEINLKIIDIFKNISGFCSNNNSYIFGTSYCQELLNFKKELDLYAFVYFEQALDHSVTWANPDETQLIIGFTLILSYYKTPQFYQPRNYYLRKLDKINDRNYEILKYDLNTIKSLKYDDVEGLLQKLQNLKINIDNESNFDLKNIYRFNYYFLKYLVVLEIYSRQNEPIPKDILPL